jgi:hypothetical protein
LMSWSPYLSVVVDAFEVAERYLELFIQQVGME